MGSNDPTARDRVWAGILQAGANGRKFRLHNVRSYMDFDKRPSDETYRRVLRAATDMNVVEHKAGSRYYKLADQALAPRKR